MKAVIFQHMASGRPGTLQASLRARGISCQVIHTAHEDLSSFDALSPDVLLVMGGAPGVYQADHYPFLKQELHILEKRLAADRPTIGICLGAQLMAAALGAKVYKGEQGPEIGWFDLSLTTTASPVNAFSNKKILQWHGDAFDAPAGATLLASSQLYPNQIFKYGQNAIAFQGHIEVTAQSLAEWFVEDAGMMARHEGLLDELRRDTALHAGPMVTATQNFMTQWLAEILPQQENTYA